MPKKKEKIALQCTSTPPPGLSTGNVLEPGGGGTATFFLWFTTDVSKMCRILCSACFVSLLVEARGQDGFCPSQNNGIPRT